jgi:methanethiol S-methyltransferase
MLLSHLLLALAWGIYCSLHSILAGTGWKRYIRKHLHQSFKYYRSFYNLVAIVLLIFLVIWQTRIPSPEIWHPFTLQFIPALLMTVTGLSGMAICLKKYFLSSGGFRDLFYEGGTPILVIEGLHRLVRHPLYLSTFIFLWGLFLFIPIWSFFIVNVIITIYTLIGIRFEENKLRKIFGTKYDEYRENVPMILPRILK